MSNPDDPSPPTPPSPKGQPTSSSLPTQRLPDPVADVDSNATVAFTPEDIARLQDEQAETAEEQDRLIGTLIREKWRVIDKLGAGSFGTVYKVEDVKGGWTEALKILGVDRMTGADAEEMRARFLREAQIMKRLGKESKHIVGLSTYEEDIEAGLIYFLMEFVEGRSLADALEQEGPFSAERTIHLALQACDGLMAAHEGPEPVVHRDLKLENLMLTTDRGGDEIVKILDFGIAKIAERDADSRLTTVGTLGTPGYAAPEQLRAEAVDGRTDLFAFGVILYALLTGRDPWLGKLAHEPTHQIYELMVATDRAEVRSLADSEVPIPPRLASIVLKLLRRDPAHRFQSARELRDALLEAQRSASDVTSASLRVKTDTAGVIVEVRSGREVVAEGPTPLVADGLQPGSLEISVRDPRYERTETEVSVEAASFQEVTLVTTRRSAGESKSSGGRRVGRFAAAMALVAVGGAAAWAQPWGRTLDSDTLLTHIRSGAIPSVWVTEDGLEGGIRPFPIPGLDGVATRFTAAVPDGNVAEVVQQIREAGAEVDVRWEVDRLLGLAQDAQARGRYFGVEGADVLTYARRLAELDSDNDEATALMRKVAERMAWDAAAALQDGAPEQAARLVEDCLAVVSAYPRCVEVSDGL